jgi:hypothetical protein
MKNSELIEQLAKYPPDAHVLVMWESTFHEPSVYAAKNGTVILDADYTDMYRERIESGKLVPR